MFDIGLMELMFLALIIGLPIWLVMRSSKKKSSESARIADALEEIAKSKSEDDKSQ
jgi:flagellar biogenesis protein FliO